MKLPPCYFSNRRADFGNNRVRGVRGATLALDAGDSHGFDAFFQELSRILQEKWGRKQFNFLVNNAGIEASGGMFL